jgi:hypothetical protein
MRDLLIECCDRLDRNEFFCHGIDRNATGIFSLLFLKPFISNLFLSSFIKSRLL